MENPFEQLLQKLNTIEATQSRILATLSERSGEQSSRMKLTDFCNEYSISKPTAYSWNDRGLIKLEKVGGRQYVLLSSVLVQRKYQREPTPQTV